MMPARARRRVLIEASKLADDRMDGIRRYVVELLKGFSSSAERERVDLDVMVLDEVYPIEDLPPRYLSSEAAPEGEPAGREQEERSTLRDRAIGLFGALVPPGLLYPIRLLMPAWLSRRVLGKEKSELRVPEANGARDLPRLLLPPIVWALLRRALPEALVIELWAQGILRPPPRSVDVSGYDLVHLTLPNNHHHLPATAAPVLVTVHDLCHVACPEFLTRSNSSTLRAGLKMALDGGSPFVAVSEATRLEMMEVYGIEPSRIVTALNGCDGERFRPVPDVREQARVRRRYGIPDCRFLLALSTIEPRKNLSGTLAAFDLLRDDLDSEDVVLVVAGAKGWKSRGVMKVASDDPWVRLTGHVEDSDLAALYSSASGFVYVSHYEGFGYPLLEAMRCGTPVIYGDNSSMPEVVGDAGLPADSRDPASIARQMKRLLQDAELARALGKRGVERARRFTSERTAARTLALYDELLCGGDSR